MQKNITNFFYLYFVHYKSMFWSELCILHSFKNLFYAKLENRDSIYDQNIFLSGWEILAVVPFCKCFFELFFKFFSS